MSDVFSATEASKYSNLNHFELNKAVADRLGYSDSVVSWSRDTGAALSLWDKVSNFELSSNADGTWNGWAAFTPKGGGSDYVHAVHLKLNYAIVVTWLLWKDALED